MQKRSMDYEPELNLKDIFFHILYHWRSCILVALIGAVLLGAYQYINLEKVHREGNQTEEEKQYVIELEAYQGALQNTQKNIENYTKMIIEQQEYEANSIWLHLDPNKIWSVDLVYQINLTDEYLATLPTINSQDPADNVLAVYESSLLNGVSDEELENYFGTSTRSYIKELVIILPNKEANTITINVVGESEEKVQKAISYLDNRIQIICQEKAQLTAAHSILKITDEVYQTTSTMLNTKQEEINKKLEDYQKKVQENKLIYNKLQLKSSEPKKPGTHIIRYAVIGAVIFGILMVAVYAIQYIMSGTLHTAGELTECYELPLYGSLPHSRAKRPGKGIDKILEKWEFGNELEDTSELFVSIATVIRENCKTNKILLTGTVSEKLLDNVKERLGKESENLKLEIQPDFLHNKHAIIASKEVQEVLWVEEKYETRIKDVDRMAEVLYINSTNVLGCILL